MGPTLSEKGHWRESDRQANRAGLVVLRLRGRSAIDVRERIRVSERG